MIDSHVLTGCGTIVDAMTTTVSIKGHCGWNVLKVAPQNHFLVLTIRKLSLRQKGAVSPNWEKFGCLKVMFVDRAVDDVTTVAKMFTAENKILREVSEPISLSFGQLPNHFRFQTACCGLLLH